MKKKLPPKKKLPFYSRVSGNAGQRRPDRKAPPERELRRVFGKADADLLDPFKPPAPPGGGETQQFTGDKPVPRPPGPRLKAGGGVKKRQEGGRVQLPGSLRSESTELAKARRGFDKAPKDVDAARKMIRTEDETGAYLPTKATGEGRYKDGGSLSSAQRQSLPSKDFALPGKGEGPKGAGSGSYPIPDRSHAANALARSSGKPVAAQVRAKVRAKYPDMGQK